MDDKRDDKPEIYSKRVKAGKRTYFFDVKSTRSNDFYLTVTESKKKLRDDGFVYEKHKIFLYKEDFAKFINALQETIDFVKTDLLPDVDFEQFNQADSEDDGQDLSW